jgi:hypothetical protein
LRPAAPTPCGAASSESCGADHRGSDLEHAPAGFEHDHHDAASNYDNPAAGIEHHGAAKHHHNVAAVDDDAA